MTRPRSIDGVSVGVGARLNGIRIFTRTGSDRGSRANDARIRSIVVFELVACQRLTDAEGFDDVRSARRPHDSLQPGEK